MPKPDDAELGPNFTFISKDFFGEIARLNLRKRDFRYAIDLIFWLFRKMTLKNTVRVNLDTAACDCECTPADIRKALAFLTQQGWIEPTAPPGTYKIPRDLAYRPTRAERKANREEAETLAALAPELSDAKPLK